VEVPTVKWGNVKRPEKFRETVEQPVIRLENRTWAAVLFLDGFDLNTKPRWQQVAAAVAAEARTVS
jgi:hypothetical protein